MSGQGRHRGQAGGQRGTSFIATLCAFALFTGVAGAMGGWFAGPAAARLDGAASPSTAAAASGARSGLASPAPPSWGSPARSSLPAAPSLASPSPASPSPATSPPPAPTGLGPALAEAVAALEASSGARLGVAVTPAGPGGGLVEAGSWTSGQAWSTVKAPLAVAALTANPSAATDALAVKAITVSDNAAAQSLWDALGSADQAGSATEAVLRQAGDAATQVQRVKTRPEFTAFGQTTWSLANQASFAAAFPAGAAGQRVWDLMGQIDASQRWGLGQFAGAHFKGGWGPDDGGYVVRQFGQIPVDGGCAAVAVGAWAPDFNAGLAALDALADILAGQTGALPAGPCR